MNLKPLLPVIGAILFGAVPGPPAWAQRAGVADKNYPSKPIRVVVPYGAGAGPDVVGRTLGERMGQSLGQGMVFDNRGGAGGMLGTDIVAKSAPDGYTLLLQTGAIASYHYFFKNVPYELNRDLVPVTMIARNVGYVFAINPEVPAKTVKELIAYAKANPGTLNFGTAGLGSVMHVAAELFDQMAGVKMSPVHYTGVPAALTDLVSGQIQVGFPAAPSALPFISAGRMRVLGISSDKRWHKLPEVPTVAEAGVPGYKYLGWYGLWAPAGTPPEYVTRLQGEVVKALKDPSLRKLFDDQGLEPVGSTPAELSKATEEEAALNQNVTKAMGLKLQ
ncbi:MAG TPA: tripartite tricarboxylate transporter substrate binding protein [Burkholderiales bacterium]|jgi:tripartite-type tricarboxylate transporter receptor subunit TctC|nr:tripartite tricarboxylate transporter substrate binding protein [Burkholderiales bacterium]